MHPYLSTVIADQRRVDLVRSAERARLVREADVPTAVESVRLVLGRSVVRLGRLIAGRRGWAIEPRPAAPVVAVPSTALHLAR